MSARLRLAFVACACAWVVLGAVRLGADTIEPPPEVADGDDYEVERADSLADGDVEVGMGYVARDGRHASRRRHASFRTDSLGGSVRDGSGDALSGTALEGVAAGGRFGVGRVTPVWGRGLAVGDAREPWAWRGRSLRRATGDVGWYRARVGGTSLGAWGGSIAHHPLAGVEVGHAGFGAGLAGHARDARASAWWSRDRGPQPIAAELALDRRGRWRTEIATARRQREASLSGWVRAGHARYRTLGDARRAGPATSVSVRGEAPVPFHPAARITALGAWWRFAPDACGARATLEVEHALAHHAVAVAGFEEQHGTRRDPVLVPRGATDGLHQGAWVEWRAAAGPMTLGFRDERWGERAWTRGAVRVVTTARIGIESPAGFAMRVTHATFGVRRGEHLYLPEVEADRLVLRALTGNGARTRLELKCPFANGSVQAALNHTVVWPHTARLQWTLDWTRHARIKRAA